MSTAKKITSSTWDAAHFIILNDKENSVFCREEVGMGMIHGPNNVRYFSMIVYDDGDTIIRLAVEALENDADISKLRIGNISFREFFSRGKPLYIAEFKGRQNLTSIKHVKFSEILPDLVNNLGNGCIDFQSSEANYKLASSVFKNFQVSKAIK